MNLLETYKNFGMLLKESIGERISSDVRDYDSEADDSIYMATVDLGLPSGTLWAKRNIGAEHEWNFGNYFGYGATIPYDNQRFTPTDYITRFFPKVDGEYFGTLNTESDTATAILGSPYKMPTKEDCEELVDNTFSFWGELNGVQGCFFFKPLFKSHKGQYKGKTDLHNDPQVKERILRLYDTRKVKEYLFFPANGLLDGKNALVSVKTNFVIWTSSCYSSSLSKTAYLFGCHCLASPILHPHEASLGYAVRAVIPPHNKNL